MGGRTSERMVSTRSAVSSDCGEVSGSAVTTMTSPSGLTAAGVTELMPGVAASSPATVAAYFSGSTAPSRSITTWSGPLKPGPKPSASMS